MNGVYPGAKNEWPGSPWTICHVSSVLLTIIEKIVKKIRGLLVVAAVLGLALTACHKKEQAAQSGISDTQAVVKVNGQTISLAEFDTRRPQVPGISNQAISKEMMQHVVEMELLRQAGLEDKLDADADTRARLANANRTILASAYLQKLLTATAKPTDPQITDYYNSHPAQFAKRKEYNLQELSLQAPPGREAQIEAQLSKSKKPEDFEKWLSANNIPHDSKMVTVTSDRLPDDVLQKLKDAPVGGSAVLGRKGQMNIMFVVGEEMQPIDLAQAKLMVTNMLMDKLRKDAIDDALKKLQAKAKIDYVPPYTVDGFSPPPTVK